jgi:hypothetical protein
MQSPAATTISASQENLAAIAEAPNSGCSWAYAGLLVRVDSGSLGAVRQVVGAVSTGRSSTSACTKTPRASPRQPCRGDLKGDRTVDTGDLAVLLLAWSAQLPDPRYDSNLDGWPDGRIDNADLQVLVDNGAGVWP